MRNRPPQALFVAAVVTLIAACASTTAPTSTPNAASSPSAPSSFPAASSSPSAPSPKASPSATAIDPANFSSTVNNPWFPLVPGTTMTYRGTKDGKRAVDIVTVSDTTILIEGVPCRVVHDRLFLDGRLEERTSDYYTQDRDGNVWYFGEDTAELNAKGNVTTTEGTWRAGVDGAEPGIFMEANPVVGHAFIQEFYPGHAEDHFQVVSLTASVTVPYGTFTNVLRTKEWTPLEPGVLDRKDYVMGVGEIREITLRGPFEKLVLVSVTHG